MRGEKEEEEEEEEEKEEEEERCVPDPVDRQHERYNAAPGTGMLTFPSNSTEVSKLIDFTRLYLLS